MYLDELILRREQQEQKYLTQTLIRCKQFRLGIYHAFGVEKFYEKDDEVQKLLNAIEQSDFMMKEKIANPSLDYSQFFPDGEIKTFGMTPELMSSPKVLHTPLEQLLRFEIEVLEKLDKKRKNVLKKLGKLQMTSEQTKATADGMHKPVRKWTVSAIKRDLGKYIDYQEKDLILQTLIVEKLLKRAEITECHRNLLTAKLEHQLKFVQSLTGICPCQTEATAESKMEQKKSSNKKWPFRWMRKSTKKREETLVDSKPDELVTSLLCEDSHKRLPQEDVYMTVVKASTATLAGYLPLKVGQIVKLKCTGTGDGVCYGWTRPAGCFSRKRYGFFRAECVVPRDLKSSVVC